MKIEEWRLVMRGLKAGKYGKMYERFKLAELVSAFQQFEGERAERMENDLTVEKSEITPLTEEQKHIFKKLAKDLDLPKPKDYRGRWQHIPHPNREIEEQDLINEFKPEE